MQYKESKSIDGELLGYWDEEGRYVFPDKLPEGAVVIPMTQDEIDANKAKVAEIEALQIATQYQRDRAREYPPITDYLDGVVKGDQAQIDAYVAACLAVKAKYPKPIEG